MKKNSYIIEDSFLSINTECGGFKFKIDGNTDLERARQAAELMIDEMEKVESRFESAGDKSSPYAKLLMSHLNISERYVQLENEYKRLAREAELIKRMYNEKSPSPSDKPEVPEPAAIESISNEPESEPAGEPALKTAELPVPEAPKDNMPSTNPGPLIQQVLNTLKTSDQEQRTPAAPMPQKQESTPFESKFLESKVLERKSLENEAPGSGSFGTIPQHATSDSEFLLPSFDFLNRAEQEKAVDNEAIRRDAELLEQKLGYFGIKGEVMDVSPGPVITTFEYKPAPGIKISKIVNLADDLALALSALSIRLVAPIPGKDVIGVEIPNARMSIVPFVDIVGSKAFADIDSPTPICLGKDIVGNPVVVGLEKMPHLPHCRGHGARARVWP